LMPVDTALERILSRVPPVTSATLPIAVASGAVLAEDVVAGHDQPPFNASAMDGYAVRAEDVAPGVALRIAGTSQAGAGHTAPIKPGECVRIFTGAPVPPGADAVIMQEDAEQSDDTVRFRSVVASGRSIRARGNDFAHNQ